MENPRPEKVAVVDEVRTKFTDADAALFTEYRGLSVRDLAELRDALRDAGGEYKIYKNTLVRLAVADLGLDVADEFVGPTAIAFVGNKPDGTPGDPVTVAKALSTFAKANPHLVIKGGLLDTTVLDADGAQALARVAPREELLARFAGGLAAPLRDMAGLLQALPLKFAYGLQALIDAGGADGAPPAPEAGGSADADSADADSVATTDTDTNTDTNTDTDTDTNDEAAPAAEQDTPAADAAADEE